MSNIVVNLPDADMDITNTRNALVGHSGEVLLIGASRCNHHYVPSILQDSLKMTVFNGGIDGTDVLLQWAVLQSAIETQKPEIVIYDISSHQLNGKSTYTVKDRKYLYGTSKYYAEAFDSVADIYDMIKIISNMYIYNSELIWFAAAYLKGNVGSSGYKPLSGTDKSLIFNETSDTSSFYIDSMCLCFLNRIVTVCKEKSIKLIFCYSPTLNKSSKSYVKFMNEYCEQNGICFINHGNDSIYVCHPEYFVDEVHMNSVGAQIYTKQLAGEIKELLKYE